MTGLPPEKEPRTRKLIENYGGSVIGDTDNLTSIHKS